jgi:hypothetical protein
MYLATINKTKQLLHLNYVGRVEPEELQRGLVELKGLLPELTPGFRVLADFGRLEAMEMTCAPVIGQGMELFSQHGVGMVVRVIPDPTKDIGLNILTAFHYERGHRPKFVTCASFVEAAQVLGL